MSLLDRKSLYDKNRKDVLGPNVGTADQTRGTYYTNMGTIDSPFEARGGSGDHLLDLLENKVVYSKNGNVYDPIALQAKSPGPFGLTPGDQDLNGADIRTLNAGNTKFGYYPNNGPSDGFY